MSISNHGGHLNTMQTQSSVDGRRRRRLHSDEFTANAVASCTQPGMSMTAVAIANSVNTNLLRRWVCEAELSCGGDQPDAPVATIAPPSAATPSFVPIQLAARLLAHPNNRSDELLRKRAGITSPRQDAQVRRWRLIASDAAAIPQSGWRAAWAAW